MNWRQRCVENLDRAAFDGVGLYDIPAMQPVHIEPVEMIGFNFAPRYPEPDKVGVHFFLGDYQFQRVWTSPLVYAKVLARFRCVCTPDYSMYTDYPLAIQIYNHYRKHWLGAWWQRNGMTVIPTISWSNERSYAWCFDGDPVGGTVAVSSVGTQMNRESRRLFLAGYEEMLRRLQPEMVLFHGDIPEECRGNILPIRAFQQKHRKRTQEDT